MYKPRMQSRRYRRPSQPATPGPETLQQLLATVVDLTKLVKSAVDFYLYRIQPDDLQTADVPPPPRKGSRTVKALVPPAVIPPPDAVTLPLCEPTTEASTPKKRLRSAVSSSDSDDDNFALCMDNAEDNLEYVLLPDKRRSSQLMYVLDEKNLYVRRYSFQNYDRYVCKVPQCRCTVQLTKPAGVARRSGDRTATHRHAHMIAEYQSMCKPIVSKQSLNPLKSAPASDVLGQLSDCSGHRSPSPAPAPVAGSSSDIEVEENVWAEMLNIEDGKEISDLKEEFTSFCEDNLRPTEADDEVAGPTNAEPSDQMQPFKEHVDRQLISMREHMDKQIQLLFHAVQANKQQQPVTQKITPQPSIKLPSLPLTVAQEVAQLNVQLLDNAYAEQMILKLKSFERPAPSINAKVRGVMEHLMTYELAVQYTWTGKAGMNDHTPLRLSFGDKHKIHALVIQTLQYRNPNIVDEKEATVAIQEFLKRSKIRLDRANKK